MLAKKINSCRCCGSTNLKSFIDFGDQVLTTMFPQKNQKNQKKIPMKVVICSYCYLVQLQHNYKLDKLFNDDYGYRSGINKTMNDHLNGIVLDIKKYIKLSEHDVVLDIASNDGTLLNKYRNKNIIKIGIDPIAKKLKKFYKGNTIISDNFFSKKLFFKLSKKNKAKAISSIAVFYDISEPEKFIRDIKDILSEDGIWVLEQSYFPLLVRNNAYDSICHEHLTYFMIKQLNFLLEKYNMRIFDLKLNDMNGGSIRIFVCHKDAIYKSNTNSIKKIYKIENELLKNKASKLRQFKKRIISQRNKLIKLINKLLKSKKIIHVYGASTKGNVVLQYCNFTNRHISFAADRNEEKWGRFTPGSDIEIISEEKSRKINPDYYLVLPWHFREEFIKREYSYLKNGGKFIFPLPKIGIAKKVGSRIKMSVI